MKKGMQLDELARKIMENSQKKVDYTVNTNAMEMKLPEAYCTVDGDIVEGKNLVGKAPSSMQKPRLSLMGVDGRFDVTAVAHQQLSAHLEIPRKFYDEQLNKNPDLFSVMVNTLMARNPKPRFVRTLDGNARAILSNSYRPIDYEDIAPMLLEGLLGSGAEIRSCDITERKLYIKALFPKTEIEVFKGDVIQMGMAFSNSEIGLGQISFEPLVYRLVCENGMIMQDTSVKRRHLGARMSMDEDGLAMEFVKDDTRKALDQALILQIRDTMTMLAQPESAQRYIMRFQDAAQQQLKDPVAAVQVLQKKASLADDDRLGILNHLVRGGDLSRWGLANAVTRHSQDVTSYDRATELEYLGGTIIDLSQSDWKSIGEAAA